MGKSKRNKSPSPLMRSVSGIRGIVGESLTPELVAQYAAAYGTFLKGGQIIIGNDARPTGDVIKGAAIAGFRAAGCDVVDVGLCPTPTIPLLVTQLRAKGGCAITASHNPLEWNALKLLGPARKPLPAKIIQSIYDMVDKRNISYAAWNKLGAYRKDTKAPFIHLDRVLKLDLTARKKIQRYRPRVVIDAVNGAGSDLAPELLRQLGCRVTEIHCTPNGKFPRRGEPVATALRLLGQAVKYANAAIGFALDPDADRLAIVNEDGKPIGEEYTLALATRWALTRRRGPVVINMSTSRMVEDVAREFRCRCYRTKVGELNVAEGMRRRKAVIGGEGNGGVILPKISYGRDSLVGMALVLSLMVTEGKSVSTLVGELPRYHCRKVNRPLPRNFSARMKRFERTFVKGKISRLDGIKADLPNGSVHVRLSNTEPIYRVIVEATSARLARDLVEQALSVLER